MTCAWGCTQFAPDDADARRYGLGAMALRYAYWGYAVLPLARGGKRPHRMLGERGGVHRASTEREDIAEWWSLDMAANIGVATGSVSRLAVVDLDMKHGTDGWRSWHDFLAGPPAAPDLLHSCPLAGTPSGGSHLWLRTQAGVAVPERPGILPGVDVKGDGGYVVAAPSMLATVVGDRSGQGAGEVHVPYEWASGCPHEAPDAPAWLYQWLHTAEAKGTNHQNSKDKPSVPDGASQGAEVGNRNRTMYVMACSLYRKLGTGPDAASEVLGRLREVWDKTDKTDFRWSEVLTCAESARRFIERQMAAEQERNRKFLAWLYGRD